jgi:hypothetical protein
MHSLQGSDDKTLSHEWADKHQLAAYLNVGQRRILSLAKEQGWRWKPGPKQPGQKMPLRQFATADAIAWKNREEAAINQDGTPALPAPAPGPERVNRKAAGLAKLLERILQSLELLPKKDPILMEATGSLPQYCYITEGAAARHISLPRKVIKQACDSGLLSFVPDRRGRMVRVRDVEQVDFGILRRGEGTHQQQKAAV